MQSLTRTAAIRGTYPILVDVECSTTSGFAGLQLVGNTSDLCRDGKERAKTALERLGFRLGQKRILMNLAPADCRKEGNHFDLPFAVSLAVLLAERSTARQPREWLFAAELGLDGSLRPVKAVIPLALLAMQEDLKGLVLASGNQTEIAVLKQLPQGNLLNLDFVFFEQLSDVLKWLFEGVNPPLSAAHPQSFPLERPPSYDDMHLTPEQQDLAVCAAVGRHSIFLRGAPGSGKSMFAARLPSLLPPLKAEHHFEVMQLYSLKWERLPASIVQGIPPIRNPHHSSSPQALLGTADEPGDLALAHGGVLFLDELPEFRRDLLEALREPLETGQLHISRAQRKTLWKADVQLIAACNNCPCGYNGSRKQTCRCGSQKLLNYVAKLSGPLMERIDIHFAMPEQDSTAFCIPPDGVQRALLQRVGAAYAFMSSRNESQGWKFNRDLSLDQIFEASRMSLQERRILLGKLFGFKLSTRSMLRLLRVARTLADMDENPSLSEENLQRALLWQKQVHSLIPDVA